MMDIYVDDFVKIGEIGVVREKHFCLSLTCMNILLLSSFSLYHVCEGIIKSKLSHT